MNKYLITLLGRYGDLILATPIFEEIKKFDANSILSVIAGRKNYEILLNNPYVDEILIYDKAPLKFIKFLFKLKFKKFDFYIDVKDHYSSESKFLAKVINAKIKIGYNKPNNSKVFDIDFTLDKANELSHFTSNSLFAISKVGINIQNYLPKPILFESMESQTYVNEFLLNKNITDFSLINISATSENRIWNIENWNELILQTDLKNRNVIITFAPDQKLLSEEFLKLNNKIILFKSRNFTDIVSLCKRAELIITPDTAIVHIASAFDKPLLALYNGLEWNYNKFHPSASRFITIRASSGVDSIIKISPNEVINGYNTLISNQK